MVKIFALLSLCMLSACASLRTFQFAPISSVAKLGKRAGVETVGQDYSVVHFKGIIYEVLTPDDWPKTVKVGDLLEGWATIDNRVADGSPVPNIGGYAQTGWPLHLDVVAGRMVISSKNGGRPSFAVTVYYHSPPNRSRYFIHPGHHVTIPEAPQLQLFTSSITIMLPKNFLQSDELPLRTMPSGGYGLFECKATAKGDGGTRAVRGKIMNFEVLQATADSVNVKSRRKHR